MNYDRLTQKKKQLDALRPLPPELVRNLDEWFTVELTYTSNALEGNTLTRRETAVVIEKGLTVGGKSLKEHLEATNHARALDFVRSLVTKRPAQLTAKDVLDLHDIVLKGLDDENAGHYRRVPVRISGSVVVLPNPRKVPELMDDFQAWLTSAHDLHPVAFAAEAHYRLVSIHPFVDGNGRTARLLMNLLLMMAGYPPAIIRKRDRLAYITSLEKAQLGGSKAAYETIIAKAAERSLDIYLKAAQGNVAADDMDSDELFKIGALAKAVGETVPTIRYWTKEGLLEVADVTDAGYQLYAAEMTARCKEIQRLKGERLTLREIKKRIEASEQDEDLYFSSVADRRDTASTVWIADDKLP
jgi:Fic family protein/DNA-binding transcriptional MerR regulator